MESGFDILGALVDEVITIRVTDIDHEKLKAAIGGASGFGASIALSLADKAPKAALDLARPLIIGKAKEYGVTLDMSSSSKSAPGKRAVSEFWPGLVAGGVVGFSIFGIIKLVGRLLGR